MSPNFTPKARFQESSQNVSKHKDLITDPTFVRAIDFAKLQYQVDLAARTTDMNTAARAGTCIMAVEEFLGVLRNLAETPVPNRIVNNDNLILPQ